MTRPGNGNPVFSSAPDDSRRRFLKILGAAGLLSQFPLLGGAGKKPNLILMVADDLGYGDLGCYGNRQFQTPALDALAASGVRFTHGYVTASVCAPSRCGILTGAYNQRFGIQDNPDRASYRIEGHEILPQALRRVGYRTGLIGKWNVGIPSTGLFDVTRDQVDWESDYFPENGAYVGVDDPNKVDSSKRQGVWWTGKAGEEYLTDRQGRHACEFIREASRAGKPFFLYLGWNAPHSPLQAPASYEGRFSHLAKPQDRMFAAMVTILDENIARIRDTLRATGQEQDTLVVFLGDNGPAKGGFKGWPEAWPKEKSLLGSAGDLSGSKGTLQEGGIREPFLLSWPGRIPAGQTLHQPVMSFDIYPTFLSAAGAGTSETTRLDGRSLLAHAGGKAPGPVHDVLFWKDRGQGAARRGAMKLWIDRNTGEQRLYNLNDDPREKEDLSGKEPEVLKELRDLWNVWSAGHPGTATTGKAKKG